LFAGTINFFLRRVFDLLKPFCHTSNIFDQTFCDFLEDDLEDDDLEEDFLCAGDFLCAVDFLDDLEEDFLCAGDFLDFLDDLEEDFLCAVDLLEDEDFLCAGDFLDDTCGVIGISPGIGYEDEDEGDFGATTALAEGTHTPALFRRLPAGQRFLFLLGLDAFLILVALTLDLLLLLLKEVDLLKEVALTAHVPRLLRRLPAGHRFTLMHFPLAFRS
jgi:hypothetical protein